MQVIEYKGHPRGKSFFIPVRDFTADVKPVEKIPVENGHDEREAATAKAYYYHEQELLQHERNH